MRIRRYDDTLPDFSHAVLKQAAEETRKQDKENKNVGN